MIRKRGMLKNVEIEGEFSNSIKKGRAVFEKTARRGRGEGSLTVIKTFVPRWSVGEGVSATTRHEADETIIPILVDLHNTAVRQLWKSYRPIGLLQDR